MDLKSKVKLKEIMFQFYRSDIAKLISATEFNVRDADKVELLNLQTSENIKDLYDGIHSIFQKNLSSEQFDLSIMLTLFLQRYNYFNVTEQEWNKYCAKVDELNLKDELTFYIDYVSFFFEEQINLYTNNYANILEAYEVAEWNSKFYMDLKTLVTNIVTSEDFVKKLEAVEQMILFLQDTKNIYASLEGVGIEERKKEFLAHSNELKIVFQSTDNLINEILLKIK